MKTTPLDVGRISSIMQISWSPLIFNQTSKRLQASFVMRPQQTRKQTKLNVAIEDYDRKKVAIASLALQNAARLQ